MRRASAPRAISRMNHQGRAPTKKRSFMALPGKPPPDEGDVDQVLFVVLRHGIEDEVDAKVEGIPSLFLASGGARIEPVAQLVSLPGAAKVVMAVDDGSRAAHADSFQVRVDDSHPADSSQEIIAAQRRVTCR